MSKFQSASFCLTGEEWPEWDDFFIDYYTNPVYNNMSPTADVDTRFVGFVRGLPLECFAGVLANYPSLPIDYTWVFAVYGEGTGTLSLRRDSETELTIRAEVRRPNRDSVYAGVFMLTTNVASKLPVMLFHFAVFMTVKLATLLQIRIESHETHEMIVRFLWTKPKYPGIGAVAMCQRAKATRTDTTNDWNWVFLPLKPIRDPRISRHEARAAGLL
ncbi:hypothetical protein EXIGLDRAFT_779542 [Exidia glandulosa HHB12029]|uniref:Uncharacterized protein n=1 Tax=Exidia glandulosa HHB12029 TaxID=1314781 RepID=A0A165ZCY7_EXIGL|nr:hypothetical protein EXIGLDRAFT_779542 [Exidia glandulosa HHB12029]